jgi:hypothetical protein
MGSYAALKGTFDSESLNVLDRAFEITWSDFKAHPPFRNAREEHELKTALRKKLIEIASSGVDDPKKLRRKVLKAMWGPQA